MLKHSAGIDITLGQGAVCPDGYGHVIDFCFDPPSSWVQVKTLVNDRSCKWAPHNVRLVRLETYPVIQKSQKAQDPDPDLDQKVKAHVGLNHCDCHPDTCSCDDWAVYVNKSKHSTHFKKEVAELVAKAINLGLT